MASTRPVCIITDAYLLFQDSFESNSFSAWSSSVTSYTGGQQVINNTPVFSGGLLPFTKGLSSIPTQPGRLPQR